jgi:transmembrane sensor
MTSKDEQVRTALAEQASEWLVANDEAPLGAEESAALVAWLKASPIHIDEFLGVARIVRDVRAAGTGPEYAVETLLARARAEDDSPIRSFWSRVFATLREALVPRWRSVGVTLAAVGTAIAGVLFLWRVGPVAPGSAPVEATALHFETRHGEQQTYRLADDSVLHLNTDSAVTIWYSRVQRLVILNAGEADFEVAAEPNRAFRVLAGRAEVVDLGTVFDVRLQKDSTVVTVVEGRVAVAPSAVRLEDGTEVPSQNQRSVQLAANQQMSVAEGQWPPSLVAVDAQRTTAWIHRQIAFDHEPLERVAAEFNRYGSKPIEIVTPELCHLEVSGVVSTDDIEEFLAFLRSLEGVQVEVTATRVRVSQK